VNVSPSTGLQAVINSYPSNTTFCLASGTYVIATPIVPKSGDRFVAVQRRQAILTGNDVASSMAFNSGGYIGGVVIRGLVITHFAPPSQGGYAALKAGPSWQIIDNEISYNANTGLFHEGDSLIQGNYIHHNAKMGLGGFQDNNVTVENNEVAFNGYAGGPDNGGSKWVAQTNLTIRNNYFHDNYNNGLWLDTNNVNAVIINNVSSSNMGTGIHDEVNCNSLYQNNTVRDNGGPEFNIVASNGTRVLDNVVGGTIAVWHQDRSAPSCAGGLNNITVHGNRIDLPDGTTMNDLTGVFVCCGATGNGLSRVKEWNYNTYAATTTAIHFQYSGINVGFSGWKSGTGFDQSSTIQ
jgi:hypothetical protein